MSTSLVLGIVAVANLVFGYALALVLEGQHRGTTGESAKLPSDLPPNDNVSQASPVEAVAPPVEDNDHDEQLLESATVLAAELHASATPRDATAEPRASLCDAACLEATIHDWWREDPQRTRPICVAQIEIDNLSQLTSKLNAASLSNLARQIERFVLATLGPNDRVASLGRSRFLAVMPDVNGPAAAATLEALRTQVEQAELTVEDVPVRVTLSAGAAQARDDEAVESLLARSASALREACSAGRNRVACDDGQSISLVNR